MRPSFTIEQIRTFLAVASREHVTQAARVLRLSQPAVTQQVQLLERALGVRLLERVGRNVKLTSAGVEVAGACLLVMRALENLDSMVRSIRGVELGQLNLGATQMTANYHLARPLALFTANHPSIELDVTVSDTSEICDLVSSGALDCALVESPLPPMNLEDHVVASDEIVLVVRPDSPLAATTKPDRRLFASCRLLTWDTVCIDAPVCDEPLANRIARLHLSSVEAVRRALLTSDKFVAALPRSAVAEDVAAKTLAILDIGASARAIHAVRRPGPEVPALEALWQVLIAPRTAS